jgi:hypothetical protein
MTNSGINLMNPVVWVFRALFLIFLLLAIWSMFYPDRYRLWNLRLYERYPWVASARIREKMRTAGATRLRIQSAVIVIYLAIMLLASLKD